MTQQNIQYICSICSKDISNYRSITNDLKFKINNCPDKEYYQELRLNVDKLCSSCYMKIINFYQCQTSIINKNSLIEDNISIDLMETSRSNTPTNLMET
ncbi:25852_t:CDS:1, partial [Gigaspora rosea]